MAIKDKNRRDAIKLFAFFKKLIGFEFENLFFFYDPRYFIFIFILGFIKILIIFFYLLFDYSEISIQKIQRSYPDFTFYCYFCLPFPL
jgi:hypothetical protein